MSEWIVGVGFVVDWVRGERVTSELACRESTSSWEKRTGVSLFGVDGFVRWGIECGVGRRRVWSTWRIYARISRMRVLRRRNPLCECWFDGRWRAVRAGDDAMELRTFG